MSTVCLKSGSRILAAIIAAAVCEVEALGTTSGMPVPGLALDRCSELKSRSGKRSLGSDVTRVHYS